MPLLAHGREITAQTTKGGGTCCTAERASDLLLHFDQHRSTFGSVIAHFEQIGADVASMFPNALLAISPDERRILFHQIGLKITVAPAGQAAAHKAEERLSATYKIQEDVTRSGTIFSMMASATWEVPTAVGSSGRGLRS
jgi:hypothetical protein